MPVYDEFSGACVRVSDGYFGLYTKVATSNEEECKEACSND